MAVEPAGGGMPGLSLFCHVSRRPSTWILTHAISTMRSDRGLVPVVSVSKTTRGRSSGRISSSMDPSILAGRSDKQCPSGSVPWLGSCSGRPPGFYANDCASRGGTDRGGLGGSRVAGQVPGGADVFTVLCGGQAPGRHKGVSREWECRDLRLPAARVGRAGGPPRSRARLGQPGAVLDGEGPGRPPASTPSSAGQPGRSVRRDGAGLHRPRCFEGLLPLIVLREKPEERLAETREEPTLLPFLLGESLAPAEVLFDHLLDPAREIAVVDGDVGFAVLLHRSVDEID